MRGSPNGKRRILVYGLERKNVRVPEKGFEFACAEIHFADFRFSGRFDEFDGVVVPQGIFEQIERRTAGYAEP